jgi:hypothetical protein
VGLDAGRMVGLWYLDSEPWKVSGSIKITHYIYVVHILNYNTQSKKINMTNKISQIRKFKINKIITILGGRMQTDITTPRKCFTKSIKLFDG